MNVVNDDMKEGNHAVERRHTWSWLSGRKTRNTEVCDMEGLSTFGHHLMHDNEYPVETLKTEQQQTVTEKEVVKRRHTLSWMPMRKTRHTETKGLETPIKMTNIEQQPEAEKVVVERRHTLSWLPSARKIKHKEDLNGLEALGRHILHENEECDPTGLETYARHLLHGSGYPRETTKTERRHSTPVKVKDIDTFGRNLQQDDGDPIETTKTKPGRRHSTPVTKKEVSFAFGSCESQEENLRHFASHLIHGSEAHLLNPSLSGEINPENERWKALWERMVAKK